MVAIVSPSIELEFQCKAFDHSDRIRERASTNAMRQFAPRNRTRSGNLFVAVQLLAYVLWLHLGLDGELLARQ